MSSRPSRGAARLAAILDALPDALLLVNTNGTVVNANTIALQTFETSGWALVGRGLLDLLPEFDSRLIPGSMRRPDPAEEAGRTKPKRMTARRTDGSEFPVEVTSANLENSRDAYENHGYSGDELLMLVVRDLSGTVDTEAELARSQRQTEMILRAAAEGVIGTDTEGRVVLVNPAAAQILGYRASDLGGNELHPLVQHSRPDGTPFPYEESPLADTLRSGRKHRVRGQTLWSKSGKPVPVDLTTAPVRDGDQLVGAVLAFTDRRAYDELVARHEKETARAREEYAALAEREQERYEALAEREKDRYAALAEREKDRYEALAERESARYEALSARHSQLLAVLGQSLRGPLEELRRELGSLAADPAGQLWPEANQLLHHLSAGYARMTTLVDNVLAYQLLDAGSEELNKDVVLLDGVVAAGVEGATELIGPGRAQFAVHAPPLRAEVDAARLSTALAHLIADVAGIDATGNARTPAPAAAGGYGDSTIVVAAAQRGEVVRIEVRGPYDGGDPVHGPIVRGIVRAHGGVLQTHDVPGMGGSAYVLEVPLGAGAMAADANAGAAGGGSASGIGAEVALVERGGSGAAAAGAPGAAGSAEAVGAAVALPRQQQAAPQQPELQPAEPQQTGLQPAGLQPAGLQPAGLPAAEPQQADPHQVDPHQVDPQQTEGSGRRRARRSSTDSFLDNGGVGQGTSAGTPDSPEPGSEGAAAPGEGPTGRRRRRAAAPAPEPEPVPAQQQGDTAASGGTGRRRRKPAPQDGPQPEGATPAQGSVVTAAEHAAGAGATAPTLGPTVPPQGMPVAEGAQAPSGRRARRGTEGAMPALPAGGTDTGADAGADAGPEAQEAPAKARGRRARRALAAANERAAAAEQGGARTAFALPPAAADRAPEAPDAEGSRHDGRHETGPHDPSADHTPPQPHPAEAPTGRRRARPTTNQPEQQAAAQEPSVPQGPHGPTAIGPAAESGPEPEPASAAAMSPVAPQGVPAARPAAEAEDTAALPPEQAEAPEPSEAAAQAALPAPAAEAAPQEVPADQGPEQHAQPEQHDQAARPEPASRPEPAAPADPDQPAEPQRNRLAQPLPAEAGAPPVPPGGPNSTQGRAISVRTLGQGVPFAQHIAEQQRKPGPVPPRTAGQPQNATQSQTGHHSMPGSGRRRKLGTPSEAGRGAQPSTPASGTPTPGTPATPAAGTPMPATPATEAQPPQPQPEPADAPAQAGPLPGPLPQPAPQQRGEARSEGRAYAIGAPDEGAEGPEPLDGPNGAVEVSNSPQPQPMDDELPPEPLDNPRRLLVWPAPDVSTQQALSDRGYRPVIVHSRDEVDAQIAAFPAALFVDPLTGPITRTALQSLRQAAVAAEVPVLVTAGLGQASREAAYGADPAVLLKALAPRDSEQHPPRVLLIEEHEEIAAALTATLERRGMQVARAGADTDAVTLATQMRPNLVVMDLMQVRRRRAGIVDWLRANGQLNRTPLVVYTAAVDQSDLPKLASGETVLFLAERSTSSEVQSRIVDLLAKIGTN